MPPPSHAGLMARCTSPSFTSRISPTRSQLCSTCRDSPRRRIREGLECVIVIDGRFAAMFRLRDAPRTEGRSFIQHLGPKHQFEHIMIISGDRKSEVSYLAEQVGISELHAEQSPEQKLARVRRETAR